MDLIFNEQSLNNKMEFNDSEQWQLMIDFAELLHVLWSAEKELPTIFTDIDFYSNDLINALFNKSLKDKKYFRIFNALLTNRKSKVIEAKDYADAEVIVSVDNVPNSSLGCLVAHEEGVPTISIRTHEIWKEESIHGYYVKLGFGADDLTNVDVIIDNISEKSHTDKFLATQKNEIFDSIFTCYDLWENREKLFPFLVFCECTRSQIQEDDDKHHIRGVMNRLKILNDYLEVNGGIYSKKGFGHKARDESDTVKNNKRLKEMRYFQKPCGKWDYFFDHFGFPTNLYSAGRIHFLPCNKEKLCYIGYIGRHLPTWDC